MKKLMLIFAVLMVGSMLCAEVNFYGSARLGFWYTSKDKDANTASSGIDKSRLEFKENLQSNSRFGANFVADKLAGKVEFGAKDGNANIRMLYGEYSINDNVKLLVGQAGDGFYDLGADQVYGDDTDLEGCGSFKGFRAPMIKLTADNFYFSLMNPNKKAFAPGTSEDQMDALIPRINLGYKYEAGNFVIHPTVGFNMAQYNEDFATGGIDETVMSCVVAVQAKMKFDALNLKAEANYGLNPGVYGLKSATNVNPGWNVADQEIEDVSTFGGMVSATYKIDETFTPGLGFGYVSSTLDTDGSNDNADDAMTVYGNLKITLMKGVYIVPEIGYKDMMKDRADNEEGSLVYFGSQFRMDF